MDNKTSLKLALFGIQNGAVWVAEDAFVTRQDDDILVEKWVGQRLVSILVRPTSLGSLDVLWSGLNKVAGETAWPPASSPAVMLRRT